MEVVVGIFRSRPVAEQAARALLEAGIAPHRVSLLAPGPGRHRLEFVGTTEAEPPGMGRVLGGVVGGAAGAAGGIELGALVSTVIPGIGPVLALGLVGAALLGIGGAAAGDALEARLREGLPRDEVYLYEDALRHGWSLVVAAVEDDETAARARRALAAAGAESVDAARERWWIGLRDAEAVRYEGRFADDEADYRAGFEAALSLGRGGRRYEDLSETLRRRYPEAYGRPAFRRGWEGGRRYEDGTRGPRAA